MIVVFINIYKFFNIRMKYLFTICLLFFGCAMQAKAFNICAVMESGFVTELSGGACPGSASGASAEVSYEFKLGASCGDGVVGLASSEECDCGKDSNGKRILRCLGGGTGHNDQYICTDCRWNNSGWLGDGITNGSEVCDPVVNLIDGTKPRIKPCTVQTNFPNYCAQELSGNQKCASNGKSWEECDALRPVPSEDEFSQCKAIGNTLSDYVCCVLIGCDQDGCACCGRGKAETPEGYDTVGSMDATWNPDKSLKDDFRSNNQNIYNSCGEYSEAGNDPENACKLVRSNDNPRNWKTVVNNATARHKCWK